MERLHDGLQGTWTTYTGLSWLSEFVDAYNLNPSAFTEEVSHRIQPDGWGWGPWSDPTKYQYNAYTLVGASMGSNSGSSAGGSGTAANDQKIRKQNGCIAKALAVGGTAALQDYIPLPLAAPPIPEEEASPSAAGFAVLGATGDFLKAGGKAVLSVGARKAGFAAAADVLDSVPFLGEAVMVIQAGKAAYDGVTAYADSFNKCMSNP